VPFSVELLIFGLLALTGWILDSIGPLDEQGQGLFAGTVLGLIYASMLELQLLGAI
jgi:uncharacterized membrane protein YeaQ/YmgE (transglycosylase-associated protein family)